MPLWPAMKSVLRILGLLLLFYFGLVAILFVQQRSMLFIPTHAETSSKLARWPDGNRTIGYCREVPNAPTIWLMMHGNAGQAADRDYVLPCMSEQDSLFVLEYPGYGFREGSPSLASINQAASEAYQLLRTKYPNTPICVLGESIGSGPACMLARAKVPPDKIVLVVPFDSMAKVASRHFPFIPVRLILRDNWNNVESLEHYAGPVEIFGAKDDTIIPIEHAKALAQRIPKARLTTISGDHNDWAENDQVIIKR